MSDKPILFSAPMVRALLAGTKTQTRRLFKNIKDVGEGKYHIWTKGGGVFGLSELDVPKFGPDYLPIKVGDHLWVRERIERANGEAVGYPADGSWLPNDPWQWKRDTLPSIHMPRWASRLTLAVTDVRVERLQDISEADAKAEGLETHLDGDADDNGRARLYEYFRGSDDLEWDSDPVEAYLALWDAINGDGAWEANPWVAAYTFTVELGNIDAPNVRQIGDE